MYEKYFNLKAKPFNLLPDPAFFYLSQSHKRALSYVEYGIRERVGFILLTGAVGSGKTTLIRNILRMYGGKILVSKIFNTKVNSTELLEMINADFNLSVSDHSKVSLLKTLNDFLIEQFANGNHPVLIIDEGQNLTIDLLEEIRMLSNLETDNIKLLQIILIGQPELIEIMSTPKLIQLRQRISVNCHLKPLNRQETEEYIFHRLEKAGDRNAVTFYNNSLDLIHGYSRGIPRLINILCDFLLLSAFADETKIINANMVKDIATDLNFELQYWGDRSEEIERLIVGQDEDPAPCSDAEEKVVANSRAGQQYTSPGKGDKGSLAQVCERKEMSNQTAETSLEMNHKDPLTRPTQKTWPGYPAPFTSRDSLPDELNAKREKEGLVKRAFQALKLRW